MNDIIGNISSMISGTFMGMGDSTDNYSSRTIILQPTINIVVISQSDMEKIPPKQGNINHRGSLYQEDNIPREKNCINTKVRTEQGNIYEEVYFKSI